MRGLSAADMPVIINYAVFSAFYSQIDGWKPGEVRARIFLRVKNA